MPSHSIGSQLPQDVVVMPVTNHILLQQTIIKVDGTRWLVSIC
uniref:Uncharacterized protein n=1 Tax=Arundo donax TaxID=35708 RepID=A0A0A9G4D8_ARUDO